MRYLHRSRSSRSWVVHDTEIPPQPVPAVAEEEIGEEEEALAFALETGPLALEAAENQPVRRVKGGLEPDAVVQEPGRRAHRFPRPLDGHVPPSSIRRASACGIPGGRPAAIHSR